MRRFSEIGDSFRGRAELWRVTGLAAVSLALYLFELGKGALPDWDDAIYAEVTKEMLRGHHWLTPYWNYHPFFEKPPLMYWAEMVTFRIFGMNEFAVRLPSALAGVGIVLLVYATTRRMAGPVAGFLAGLVLLTTLEFDYTMRLGTMDALLVLFIYLTVYGYVRLHEGDGRWFYVMSAALALGILAKGPAVLVAPMAIGLDWILQGRKSLVSAKQFWLGMALLTVIALPWHLWMLAKFGSGFFNVYIGHQILERTFQPFQQSVRSPLYYFHVIEEGALPWCVIAVVAGAKWLWNREWKHTLPWLLMIVTVALYTLVVTKYRHYVLPFFPAMAMEVGWLLSEWSRKWRVIGYAAALVMVVGVGYVFHREAIAKGDAAGNMEKPLALVAKRLGDTGPFFVVGEAGPVAALDMRDALFYSSRDVVWQQLPEHLKKLEAAVKEYRQVDVMMQKSTARTLGQWYVIEPVAEAGNTILARVSRKP